MCHFIWKIYPFNQLSFYPLTALSYGLIENFMSSSSTSDHREQLYLHDRISQLEDDNYRLRKREEASKASLSDSSVNETQLKASLTKAYKDLV